MTDAMIVKLAMRAWSASRTDKAVSEEIASAKGATPDAGRYVKNLVDRTALKNVRAAMHELREHHHRMTRPWDDDGRRLVPLALLPSYEADMGRLTEAFQACVDAFIAEYPGLRDYAAMTLGEMFDPGDYPTEAEIADRFGVELHFEPMPKGDHAPPGYEDRVEKAVKARMKESHDELFNRVVNSLTELNRKLIAHDQRIEADDKRGRFRLSVLDDLEGLVEILPSLNIENDPFLNGVHERLVAELKNVTAMGLRDDDGQRKLLIAGVDDLLTQMKPG